MCEGRPPWTLKQRHTRRPDPRWLPSIVVSHSQMSSSNLSSCFPRQAEPDAAWASDVETPWWKDSSYVLGRLTAKTRRIKLLNMLSRQETILEVCSEETLNEILRRYMVCAAPLTPRRSPAPLAPRVTCLEPGVQCARAIVHLEADRLEASGARSRHAEDPRREWRQRRHSGVRPGHPHPYPHYTHIATPNPCPNPAARLTWALHRKLGS